MRPELYNRIHNFTDKDVVECTSLSMLKIYKQKQFETVSMMKDNIKVWDCEIGQGTKKKDQVYINYVVGLKYQKILLSKIDTRILELKQEEDAKLSDNTDGWRVLAVSLAEYLVKHAPDLLNEVMCVYDNPLPSMSESEHDLFFGYDNNNIF